MGTARVDRRGTVTRRQVVDAARDLLDEHGTVDGLTMAGVAARVGFTTMAVYRHVKSRDELIASAIESVLGEIAHEPAPGDWLDGVEAWMHEVRRCLLAHPWAATQLGTGDGGGSRPWNEVVAVLAGQVARSPMGARDQTRALAWTARLVVGMLILEIGAPIARSAQRQGKGKGLRAGLAAIDDDDLWADSVEQTRRFLTALGRTRPQ